jgi:quercetin dioxygenase-like cupin family protein
MRRILIGASTSVLLMAVAFGLGRVSVAQPPAQTPPTQNSGVNTTNTAVMDLSPEIEGLISLAPGGMFAVHNHRDRPTVEFIMSGSPTEFRGSAERIVRQGEAVLSDKDTTHWWRNDGSTPVIFVAADIFWPQ